MSQTRGGLTVFGDVKVDEQQAPSQMVSSLTVILYARGGATIFGRTTVPVNGRYRFNNIPSGEYDLAVEAGSIEIGRITISVAGRPGSDFQQDLEFAWTGRTDNAPRPGTVSANEVYKRSSESQSHFVKGERALDSRKYDEAVDLFRRIVAADNNDFQAWSELGTAYLMQDKKDEAEKAYQKAVEARPTFGLALLNLGRVQIAQKKFAEAVTTLTVLLKQQPISAEGNLLLGEAYLQLKKGSLAVPYFNEAAKLGRDEAHLRLASLYDAAGLKQRAVAEYQAYLKQRPDDPLRKRLEKYIAENEKP